jgi:alpha-N-arabinofuranosidase
MAALSAGATEFSFEEAPATSLVVKVGERAKEPVSPWLFGKFSEHLGRNIYDGLWAEIIENPGMDRFDKIALRPKHTLGELKKANRRETVAAIEKEVPYHWLPMGDASAVYSFASMAPHSQPNASICTLARSVKELTGITQRVALPSHRCTEYDLVLHLRHQEEKSLPVQVQVLNAESGNRLLDETVPDLGKKWKKYTFRFPIRKTTEDTPVFFQVNIGTTSQGAFAVDSVSLMPVDNLKGWCPDAIRLIRETQCPMMRFPGGNFVSGYHWQDGVGPQLERTTVPNPAWNGQSESNRVGTDEWMDFMELTGCEPLLCINAGNGTPEEALQWLEYLNGDASTPMGKLRAENGHPAPYDIRYVEIGNELYGGWQVGHCNAREYAQSYQAFHALLSKHYPNIRYIANGGPKHNPDWNEELLRRNGRNVQTVSIHYLFDNNAAKLMNPDDFYRLSMAQAFGVETEMDEHQRQFNKYSPGAGMAVTELMLFPQSSNPACPMSKHLAEALWYSGFINSCMRQGDFVEILTYSASMNHGSSLQKVDGQIYPTPGWLAYTLYSTAEGRHPCAFELKTPFFKTPKGFENSPVEKAPLIDAFCLADAKGEVLNIFIANRDTQKSVTLPVSIQGGRFSQAVMETITGDGIADLNTARQPDKIQIDKKQLNSADMAGIVLPKLSLTRITFRK